MVNSWSLAQSLYDSLSAIYQYIEMVYLPARLTVVELSVTLFARDYYGHLTVVSKMAAIVTVTGVLFGRCQ